MKKKSFIKLTLMLSLLLMFVVSCGKKEVKEEGPIELTYVTFTETGEEFLEKIKNVSEEYKKVKPNVNIKFEVIPATEYDNMMKIRNSGKKLPDIFPTRVVTMELFKDSLLPLNELEASKKNLFSKEFEIDGNVYGLPMYGFNEFVYYRKSVFEELGLKTPQTWDEFVKLNEDIKNSGKYISLAIGAKESWTTYPFNEFMPFYEADGDDIWNKMSNDDAPFTKGKPFYDAYEKIQKLYATKSFGDDPLGYGWDQQRELFASKKAAMLAAGQWYYTTFLEDASDADKEDVGVFILPARNKVEDPFRYMVSAEVFIGVSKTSAHPEAAKDFVNWLFTSDYYKEFIDYRQTLPTMEGIKSEGSMFGDAVNAVNNPQPILQKGGSKKFLDISNEINFDVKGMGQQMMQGVDFDSYMNEFNAKWKAAKEATE